MQTLWILREREEREGVKGHKNNLESPLDEKAFKISSH